MRNGYVSCNFGPERRAVFTENLSFVGGERSEQKFEDRRLAFAVSAYESDAFFFVHGKGDARAYGRVSIAECDVFEIYEHTFPREEQITDMKNKLLKQVRDIEQRLKYADPSESAKLTQELVRLKEQWLDL